MIKQLILCFLFVTVYSFAQTAPGEDENIKLVQTYWSEVWNNGNLDGVEDFYHPNAIHGKKFSYEKFKKNVVSTRDVVPDLKVIIDDIFTKDDKVITRVRYTGTHSGKQMFGQEALGKELDVPGMDIFTIKDGKCIEHQHVADHLDMVMQMGMKLTPVQNDSIAIVRLLIDDFKTRGTWDIDKHIKNCTDNYRLIEKGEIWDMEREKKYYADNSKRVIDRKDYFDFHQISIYDNTAAAVYRLKSEVTETDKLKTHTWNESALFRKVNGEWKIELIHSTPVEKESK